MISYITTAVSFTTLPLYATIFIHVYNVAVPTVRNLPLGSLSPISMNVLVKHNSQSHLKPTVIYERSDCLQAAEQVWNSSALRETAIPDQV